MSLPRRRPAETATATLGTALAVKLGTDDDTAAALAVLAVAYLPGVVTAVKEHGVFGIARRILHGRSK